MTPLLARRRLPAASPKEPACAPPAFRFALLAAQTGEGEIPLPRRLDAMGGGLVLEWEAEAGHLAITLQLQGYAALKRWAGRAMRLESGDGALDVPFAFDASGHARLMLPDSPETRRALRAFYVRPEG